MSFILASLSRRQVCSSWFISAAFNFFFFWQKTWYQSRGMHKSGLILFLKYCTCWLGWMTKVLNCTESNFQQLIPCAVLQGYWCDTLSFLVGKEMPSEFGMWQPHQVGSGFGGVPARLQHSPASLGGSACSECCRTALALCRGFLARGTAEVMEKGTLQ